MTHRRRNSITDLILFDAKVDEFEASNYTCKMSDEKKSETENNLKEMSEYPVNLKSHYEVFRTLQRVVFHDLSVKEQIKAFPWLMNVSLHNI